MMTNIDVSKAMTVSLEEIFDQLPAKQDFVKGIRRAPKRPFSLSRDETILALKNALRYIPEQWHTAIAPEFLDELLTRGRIYGYRFRPPPGNYMASRSMAIKANALRVKHFRS